MTCADGLLGTHKAYKALTLTGADALELLAKAPTPAAAAKLTSAQISAALKKARRRDIPAKAAAIQQALRAEHLGQPEIVNTAYAATTPIAGARVPDADAMTISARRYRTLS